jgi:riboflavin synthase
MFTGLIETVGTIKGLKARGNYKVLTIGSSLPPDQLQIGESIACDGPCLTVVEVGKGVFDVEASQETLARTTLGGLRNGSRINLERALQVGSRLGGHFVSGHIDETGTVETLRSIGESWELAVRFDTAFDGYVIEKGSIAINGVSLTINTCRPGWFSVNIIPHTIKSTTLGDLRAGGKVNLEFDMIGKYIVKMTAHKSNAGLTKDKLFESGW